MSLNLTAIKAHYQASTVGDVAGMIAPLTSTTCWKEMAGSPYAGVYVGREAILEGVFKQLAADWQSFSFKLDQMMEDRDVIIALGWYSGTARATQKPMEARVAHVWTMSEGKALRFEQFADTKAMTDAMTHD